MQPQLLPLVTREQAAAQPQVEECIQKILSNIALAQEEVFFWRTFWKSYEERNIYT